MKRSTHISGFVFAAALFLVLQSAHTAVGSLLLILPSIALLLPVRREALRSAVAVPVEASVSTNRPSDIRTGCS